MPTVFVTVFEGVEAKNILRTNVLATLLSRPDIRLVLFMKNQERVERYRKEFNDPRLIYEVVPRPAVKGLDAFFSRLKFVILRTPTTDLRRRLRYETDRRWFAYMLGRLANWLMARPRVRRLARWADLTFVRSGLYAPYFERYRPDAVLCAHLFDEPEVGLLRQAKRRRVLSIGLINSWDKVTARCILRLLADRFIVFNDLVRHDLARHNEVPTERVFVAGMPQYDHYFKHEPTPRETFARRLGIDPAKPIIVVAPESTSHNASIRELVDMLDRLNQTGRFGRPCEILVRFQPNDRVDEAELKRRPHIVFEHPGTRFAKGRGVDWDFDAADLRHLADTLNHMALLICHASSIAVDAAVFDKPIIHVDFELNPEAPPLERATLFYAMAHYQAVLQTGAARMVRSEEKLVEAVRAYLENPALDSEKRKRLAQEQCQFLDGMAGERIGKFILGALERNA